MNEEREESSNVDEDAHLKSLRLIEKYQNEVKQ